MEGLIPLVYRAIVEYRKAREVAIGSLLRGGALLRRCWQLARRVSLPGRVAAGEGQPGVAPPPLGVAAP